MKIACISASRIPSTTANSMQVMKVCQALHQLGHDVHLFVPQNEKRQNNTDIPSLYGLKLIFPITWLPSQLQLHRYDFAFQAARKAIEMKASLAYVWLFQAGIFSLLAHIPVILELHGPPEGRFGLPPVSKNSRSKAPASHYHGPGQALPGAFQCQAK
jgi:hypothetical protein